MLRLVDGSAPEKEVESTTAYKSADVFTELKDLISGQGNFLQRALSLVSSKVGFEAVLNATRQLDTESANLVKALGVGSQRSIGLTNLISETIPKVVGMGMEATDVAKIYEDIIGTFNTNIMLSDENITELGATTKVTGVSTKELAEAFRGVGMSIDSVGETMLDVTQIANKAGVTVSSVSAGVVKNMDKMNLYNFQGGVEGLAKMSVQASRLGIDMEKVFSVVDQVFNPEGAIELAASLQRLGVQTSEMLDPLRLMDLAQNDPAELQNQIVGMTKQFTRFNEETGSFEILPGAKRQMAEIGKELGMTGGEFQKMALNAANFDSKLKQIKFSPDVKEEDREFIATMSKINEKGESIVKVALKDEKGEFTGEYDTVMASNLTTDQIKAMKEEQELRGATMETIAFDQLSEQKKTNATIDELVTTLQQGFATTTQIQGLYKGGLKLAREGTSAVQEKVGTVKDVRQTPDEINKLLKSMGVDLSAMAEDLGKWANDLLGSDAVQYIKDGWDSVIEYITPGAKSIVNTVSSSASAGITEVSNLLGSNLTTTTSTPSTPSIPESITLNHIFDFKNVPQNMTSTEVTTIMKDWATNAQNAYTIVAAAGKVNTGLT
jgi:hypothetical protein